MKKEKMKQICNYFMKGLLLCALVFGFWFMADAGVNADEVGIPKNFTPGTIEMVPFTKGENSNPYINITNNSDKPIKVTFEHNIEQTDHNYKLSIYVGNHECVSRQNPVAKDANVLYLYPYQRIEKACEVIFSSSASSSTSVTFYIKAAYLSKEVKKKEQAIGLNKNTAVEIPLSGMQNSLYEGVTVPGRDERWYKFNVSERAVINPTFELAEKERCNLFHQNQTFIKIYNSRDELMYSEAATQCITNVVDFHIENNTDIWIKRNTDEAIITATVKTPVVLIIGEAPDVRLKTPRRKDKLPFLQQLPHQKCWEKELEEEKIIFSLRQHKRNCQFISVKEWNQFLKNREGGN